ncbi:AEC family transporter [Ancylothrix sp. C2]|uniref:AEC family transporter n=1 Tax=Ancylothrix sp. D3o TaxID=2953691 RepID=UPI0021BA7870|nr:AEC family transporter [Ancylothrix sp. D3o]MCT7951547.1 AEC family transporter [Ancylothrix sp. D3o]
MNAFFIELFFLYGKLAGGVVLGWILGRFLPNNTAAFLGKFLFWVGVPVSVVAFLRHADLSGSIWLAAVVAWVAIFLGWGLGILWLKIEGLKFQKKTSIPTFFASPPSKLSQGSFLLTAMVGNTGYLGYPVALALVGQKYFAWALFYDLLGTMFGAYGLGVVIAARYGTGLKNPVSLGLEMFYNPTLWSFAFGLLFRNVFLPSFWEESLQFFAWFIVALSLILIGMRLSQLSSWRSLKPACISLLIKMIIVPLIVGVFISFLGISGSPLLVIVLQMAMPPAFATLVLAETYNLDRELTVTALAIGSVGLLFTLPVWLWLFG